MSAAARRTNERRKNMLENRRYVLVGIIVIVIILLATLLYNIMHSGVPMPKTQPPQKAAITQPTQQKPTTQPDTNAQLNTIVTNWAKGNSFASSVVVRELGGSKRSATYNADASIVPASTYKIYVAYAVLHAVEQGSYTLASPTDSSHTINTDLSSMIVNSDNDAARRLGFLIGWKNINALLRTQGINSTDLYNYVPPSTTPVGDKHTTANDLTTALNKLQSGQLLNADNTRLLLGLMKSQHYRERIPSGIPSGIAVADKPGWLSPADGVNEYIENDAAIVYGSKSTYLLVITTTSHTTQPLANLSKQVYDYLQT